MTDERKERKIVDIAIDRQEGYTYMIADDGTAWLTWWQSGSLAPYQQVRALPPIEVTP